MESSTMKVCYCDRKTPLIWTFKFRGKEYWCPRCGYTSGMFGAGMNVPITEELKQSLENWKEKAKDFLSDVTEDWEYTK